MGKRTYTLRQLEPLAAALGYGKEQLRELDRYLPRGLLGDTLMTAVPPEKRGKGGIVGRKRAVSDMEAVMLEARLGAAQEFTGVLPKLTMIESARKRAGEEVDVLVWLDGENSNGLIIGPNKKEADFDLAEYVGDYGSRFIFFYGDDGEYEGHTPIKGVATAAEVTINDLRASVDAAVKSVLAPDSKWVELDKDEQDIPDLTPLTLEARELMLLHDCGDLSQAAVES